MPRSGVEVSLRHLGPATRRTDAYRDGTLTRWRSAASLRPLGRDTALATGRVTAHKILLSFPRQSEVKESKTPVQTVRADFPHTAFRWPLVSQHYAASQKERSG